MIVENKATIIVTDVDKPAELWDMIYESQPIEDHQNVFDLSVNESSLGKLKLQIQDF